MLLEGSLANVHGRVLVLRSMPTLSGLDEAGFAVLAENGVERTFAAGDVIVAADRPVAWVHVVVSGRARVTWRGRAMPPVQRPGAIGWLSVMAMAPAGLEAVAETPMTTLAFEARVVEDALEENFSIVSNSLRLISEAFLEGRRGLPATVDAPEGEGIDTPYPEHPETLVERLLVERSNPVLDQVNLAAVAAFYRRAQERRYEPGDVLWRAGELASGAIRIRWGRVCCESVDGERVTIAAPFFLGAMDSRAGIARAYTAIAETRVVGQVSENGDSLEALEAHFSLSRAFLRVLGAALIEEVVARLEAASTLTE